MNMLFAHTCQMGRSFGVCWAPCAVVATASTIANSPLSGEGHCDNTGRSLCRYGKSYEAVHLEDVPHRVLTRPRKVFEYIFEGQRPARGRENMVKLDVSADNTVVLHTAAKCLREVAPATHKPSSGSTHNAAADHIQCEPRLHRPEQSCYRVCR